MEKQQSPISAETKAKVLAFFGYFPSPFLFVDSEQQKLFFYSQQQLTDTYPISTAKNGLGNLSDSFQTPVGFHQIGEKIGNDVPFLGRFIHRKFTGEIIEINHSQSPTPDVDVISTRILRLKGLEEGLNNGEGCDSFLRWIYIHGTNEEGLIGRPVSHGCIRMKNQDVLDIYEKVEEGTKLLIQ